LNHEFAKLVTLVCEACREFRGYDPRRIAVSLAPSKGEGRAGIWAHVIPLRYVGGKAERRGRRGGYDGVYAYESPELAREHPEALYLMTFMLPRFFRLTPRERLETVVHELYHLHPELRGDLRRFPSPHVHHGPTPAAFRQRVRELTDEALREFPTLIEHPLIADDGAAYARFARRRYRHPRQVFRPLAPAPRPVAGRRAVGGQYFLFGLALLLAWFWALNAQAISVTTKQAGTLYAQPSQRMGTVGSFAPGARFEALRLSPQRTWVELSGNGQRGWVPRTWVQALVPGAASASEPKAPPGGGADFVSDASAAKSGKLPVESPRVGDGGDEMFDESAEDGHPDLEQFDARLDKYFAARPGRLFEKPNALSNRYGIVEANDEFKVLQKSGDGKWTRVRLQLTGEEGWVPSDGVRREHEKRLGASGPWAAELATGWASKDHGLGLGGGVLHNFLRKGLAGRPRDRFEAGLQLATWLGHTFVASNSQGKTSALSSALYGRYLAVDADARLFGGFEIGFQYDKLRFTQTGIQNSTLAAQLAKLGNASSFGLLIGIVGGVSLAENWHALATVRTHVATRPFLLTTLGVDYRF
jgi:hypothetical protein